MKNLIYCLFGILIIGCSETPKSAMLTGTIENPVDTVIIINFYEKDTIYTVPIDEENVFLIEIPLDTLVELSFWHGEEYAGLILKPGYDLNLTVNTDSFNKSLVFEGTGADPNNYNVAKLLLEDKEPEYDELMSANVEEFKQNIEIMHENQQLLIDDFRNKEAEDFWNVEEVKILYAKLGMYQRYPEAHKYFTGADEVDLGEDYDNYLDEADFNRPEYLDIGIYTSFIVNHIRGISDEKTVESADEDQDQHLILMQTTTDVISHPDLINAVMYKMLLSPLRYYDIKDTRAAVEYFLVHCTDESYKSEIQEIVEKKESLTEGKPAPDFTGTDLVGNSVSLSDFIGKYVFVDIWATWCGPCRVEIPHLKELETEFHDRNIVFISYSVDDNKKDWEKMVVLEELQGVQIIGDKGWGSKINEDYMIAGIPTSILIDREGKIITSQAERPSGNIKEIILALEGI